MGTSKIKEAMAHLDYEILQLEEGKISVDKLIDEKRKQIYEFNLLIEKAHEEAGRDKETKPFKTA